MSPNLSVCVTEFVIKRVKRILAFRLYGYCLMPNHIHLVEEPEQPRDLAKFMQRINRSSTAYFNGKYKKVGHLWQGRFKSKVTVKDRYLIDCINYIELNPVRAAMVSAPQQYCWSSYKERNLGVDKEMQMLDNLNL